MNQKGTRAANQTDLREEVRAQKVAPGPSVGPFVESHLIRFALARLPFAGPNLVLVLVRTLGTLERIHLDRNWRATLFLSATEVRPECGNGTSARQAALSFLWPEFLPRIDCSAAVGIVC